MFSYLFTFRSQTAAQSGRRILYEAGLWTQLRRAPQEVSSLGCTWGVYVEGADGVHAAQLLRAWSSPVSGAYRVHPNGFLEQAQLMIYLDAGATTLQKPPAVALAVQSAMCRMATPGRGGHPPAMRAADAVYDCRCLAGALFDAQPEQVVFTMNATHALNLAIKTLVKPGGRAVISGFEHNAVLRPLHHLGAEIIVAGRRLFDPADTISAFDRAITPGTSAVICTHVSNVFGYILPVEEIAALCRARGVPFVLDASQSAGLLPVRLAELGADFIGMPGHKALYGPQGTGLLLCARMPDTLLEGGSGSASRLPDMPPELPDHAEAGTQNVCGICGLAAGLRFVRQQTPQRLLAHEIRLRRLLASMMEDIPGIRLFTGEAQSGTLSLCAAQTDCETLAARLASEGICVRAGLHCAPLAHESAGTLETGTVRFSLSAFNTEREILEIAKHIRSCLK